MGIMVVEVCGINGARAACDHPGCVETVHRFKKKTEFISYIRTLGWAVSGSTCRCPEHRRRK